MSCARVTLCVLVSPCVHNDKIQCRVCSCTLPGVILTVLFAGVCSLWTPDAADLSLRAYTHICECSLHSMLTSLCVHEYEYDINKHHHDRTQPVANPSMANCNPSLRSPNLLLLLLLRLVCLLLRLLLVR